MADKPSLTGIVKPTDTVEIQTRDGRRRLTVAAMAKLIGTGDAGEKGERGKRGKTGLQGQPGGAVHKGDRGPQGHQGPVGPQGEKGERGESVTGPKGTQGAQGATGERGPIGPAGPRGVEGPKGADGAAGTISREDYKRLLKILDRKVKRSVDMDGGSNVGIRGLDGEGVVPGGSTGQVLRKVSNKNYDTEWATVSGGGGGGHVIEDGEVDFPQRESLNFDGTQFTLTDDSVGDRTTVAITDYIFMPYESRGTAYNKNWGSASGTVAEGHHTHSSNTLNEFNITAPSNGNILQWDNANSEFIDVSPAGAGISEIGHTHPGVYEPADATILKDADIGVTVAAFSHTHALDDASDVDLTGRAPGDVFWWNGGAWAVAGVNELVTFSTLSDTAFSGLADNDVLQYDNASGDWVNRTIAGAGLAAAGHNHDGTYLKDVVDDTTPQLGGDLDAQEKNVTDVRTITVDGQSASYTSSPGAFVGLGGDHTWDFLGGAANFGRAISSAVAFTGTQTIKGGNANPFGVGDLFQARAIVQNEPTEANNLASFYTLNSANTFRANDQTITCATTYSAASSETFDVVGTGELTVGDYCNYVAAGIVKTGATVNRKASFLSSTASAAGTIDYERGLVSKCVLGTNKAHILLGYTVGENGPTGDWSLYQGNGDEKPAHWNGGQQWKVDTDSGTTLTLDKTHHIVSFSSTSTVTVTLPAASDGEQEYIIKKTGASGTININRDGGAGGTDTMDGTSAATLASISTQYHLLRIVSDGTSAWHILHNGAP